MDSKTKLNQYKEEYSRKNYDRIQLVIPKGEKDEIKKFSDKTGESVNAFIYRAIVERIAKLSATITD